MSDSPGPHHLSPTRQQRERSGGRCRRAARRLRDLRRRALGLSLARRGETDDETEILFKTTSTAPPRLRAPDRALHAYELR